MVVKNKQSCIEYILSNKIIAVLGRDNPKDIFDIYIISRYFSFNWKHILDATHKKTEFDDADLIIRLKSFSQNLLNEIILADDSVLNNFTQKFPKVIDEIKAKKLII